MTPVPRLYGNKTAEIWQSWREGEIPSFIPVQWGAALPLEALETLQTNSGWVKRAAKKIRLQICLTLALSSSGVFAAGNRREMFSSVCSCAAKVAGAIPGDCTLMVENKYSWHNNHLSISVQH